MNRPARPRARKPQRAGLFTQVPKNLGKRLADQGCSLQEIGLYFTMYTSPDTSSVGYIYRRHEWADIVGCNADSVDIHLASLEKKELIVVSGAAILLTRYMAEQAFNQPKYLKSGVWDLQRSLDDKPLLRFFIGVQLLGLNCAAMTGTKSNSAREAAQAIWEEVAEDELPPARHLHGNLTEPNRTMLDSLARMPDAEIVRAALDERRWLGVASEVRLPMQEAFDAVAPSSVAPFRPRSHVGT